MSLSHKQRIALSSELDRVVNFDIDTGSAILGAGAIGAGAGAGALYYHGKKFRPKDTVGAGEHFQSGLETAGQTFKAGFNDLMGHAQEAATKAPDVVKNAGEAVKKFVRRGGRVIRNSSRLENLIKLNSEMDRVVKFDTGDLAIGAGLGAGALGAGYMYGKGRKLLPNENPFKQTVEGGKYLYNKFTGGTPAGSTPPAGAPPAVAATPDPGVPKPQTVNVVRKQPSYAAGSEGVNTGVNATLPEETPPPVQAAPAPAEPQLAPANVTGSASSASRTYATSSPTYNAATGAGATPVAPTPVKAPLPVSPQTRSVSTGAPAPALGPKAPAPVAPAAPFGGKAVPLTGAPAAAPGLGSFQKIPAGVPNSGLAEGLNAYTAGGGALTKGTSALEKLKGLAGRGGKALAPVLSGGKQMLGRALKGGAALAREAFFYESRLDRLVNLNSFMDDVITLDVKGTPTEVFDKRIVESKKRLKNKKLRNVKIY